MPLLMIVSGKPWKDLEFGYLRTVTTPQLSALDSVAARITELRTATRQALIDNDPDQTRQLQGQLRSTESAWHSLIDTAPAATGPAEVTTASAAGFALPVREQIHRVLSLIGVPARPTFITAIDKALFSGQLTGASFTSLRRDEERSWNLAGGPRRPYYIVPALAVDDLTPVRALLALSTWAPEERIVGPLSQRADHLSAAAAIAGAVMRMDAHEIPDHPAYVLLEDLASGLGILPEPGRLIQPAEVIDAASREYQTNRGQQDQADRRRGAAMLADLSTAEQLFGRR